MIFSPSRDQSPDATIWCAKRGGIPNAVATILTASATVALVNAIRAFSAVDAVVTPIRDMSATTPTGAIHMLAANGVVAILADIRAALKTIVTADWCSRIDQNNNH